MGKVPYETSRKKFVRGAGWGVILLGTIVSALWWAGHFELVVNAFSAQPLGIRDPVFGFDLADYLFSYDMLRSVRDWILLLAFLSLIQPVVMHGIVTKWWAGKSYRYEDYLTAEAFKALNQSLRRVSLLIIIMVLGTIILGPMRSVIDGSSSAIGSAGFVDTQIRPTMRWIFAGSGVLAATILFIYSFVQNGKIGIPLGALGQWILVSTTCLLIVPIAVQQFKVEPRELTVEAPYLQYQLEGSRTAWGLSFEEREPTYNPTPSEEFLRNNNAVLETSRIIDWTPTLRSFERNDELMGAYHFHDVDVDRYDGQGLMLSVREMSHDQLPQEAKSWLNRTLIYTHGYGFTVVHTNKTQEDLPNYLVRNIPPEGEESLLVEHPEIYFGELTTNDVVVDTLQEEFNYPSQTSGSVMTHYEGVGGIRLGSGLRRFALATAFKDWHYLFSSLLTPESRALAYRSVDQRTRKVLQDFVICDEDPYAVLEPDMGEVTYLRDCYTTSGNYPYSTRTGGRNYMRSSVIVTLGAWSGETHFWIKDPSDPVVQLLERAFPSLFDGTFEDMPVALQEHIRYPDDLIKAQAQILATHHMESYEGFYRQDNAWAISKERIDNEIQTMDPRYVLMDVGNGPEFVSNMFFSPTGEKMNLLGILTGRCDPEHYGELLLTRFPRDEQALGPQLAEARINQDEEFRNDVLALQIGKEADTQWGNTIGLLAREGDSVSPVYIKSLYISAAEGYPTIAYVVGVTPNRVVYGKTLEEVLGQLYAQEAQQPQAVEGESILQTISRLWAEYKACATHECEGVILDQLDGLLTVPEN